MGAAKSETEVLAHMGQHLRRHGEIGPANRASWDNAKRTALRLADGLIRPELEYGLPRVLDLGVGDLRVMEGWGAYRERRIDYVGVEGCDEVRRAAQAKCPYPIHGITFGELVKPVAYEPGWSRSVDIVVALDVLYHIPSAELHGQLVDWIASRPARAVVISYATAQQDFGGRAVGEPGFAWFPWPFPRDVLTDRGYRPLMSVDYTGGPQKQRLTLYYRSRAEAIRHGHNR